MHCGAECPLDCRGVFTQQHKRGKCVPCEGLSLQQLEGKAVSRMALDLRVIRVRVAHNGQEFLAVDGSTRLPGRVSVDTQTMVRSTAPPLPRFSDGLIGSWYSPSTPTPGRSSIVIYSLWSVMSSGSTLCFRSTASFSASIEPTVSSASSSVFPPSAFLAKISCITSFAAVAVEPVRFVPLVCSALLSHERVRHM